MKISIKDALGLWLEHRCDNLLLLLISGAATKPEVKELLEDRKATYQPKRTNPIRRKAFHGNYRSFFPGRKKKPINEQEFTLK